MVQYIAGAAEEIIGAGLPMRAEVKDGMLVIGIGETSIQNSMPIAKAERRAAGRAVGANLVSASRG